MFRDPMTGVPLQNLSIAGLWLLGYPTVALANEHYTSVYYSSVSPGVLKTTTATSGIDHSLLCVSDPPPGLYLYMGGLRISTVEYCRSSKKGSLLTCHSYIYSNLKFMFQRGQGCLGTSIIYLSLGLAGSANADFTFVIASQGEMAGARAFQWSELNSRSKPIATYDDAD
jgi:hypothetical protein